ncbi:hypothetical protein [Achromobacter sp. Root170]|uniref:hypothetical protein n=1 Tax=Achromobacter sp. Root170 TaxID=1736480 RepID=UPI0006F49F90|nr:hypothetical protein [Achromobacter sp. Root170]KRB15851.1 hypothetical protein ASD87_24325 [Achromobacter sp. Root170]
MTASVARLVGADWEEWANRLLSHHYGPTEYQRVPSKDRGDAGIEGFCIANCLAFQCYGCDEPISVQERYDKQRDKMTEDLTKFIQNKIVLQRLFRPSLKIKRWILFVPLFDSKEIVAHAAKKTKEILSAALPYVDTTFRVMVVQESSYSVAREQLLSTAPQGLRFNQSPITEEEVDAWSTSNDKLVDVLKTKLARLPMIKNEAQLDAFVGRVLKWYLMGQELLEQLRKYPDVYEKVIATKSHREEFLALSCLDGIAANARLNEVVADFKNDLQAEAGELHTFTAQHLATEAVADWLMRCPLDFPSPAHD